MASGMDTGMENVLETSREDFASARNELYFVDASVPGAEALMVGLGEGSRVYALENTSDVFAQIEAALASAGGAVDAIHIYAHGREGALQLGGRWVDASTLADSADILARIGEALARGADILLYGCNTGAGSLGAAFVRTLADLTGADVAASDDVTGTTGDWDLESTAGAVETAPKIPGGWDGTLNDEHQRWGILHDTEGDDSLTGFVSDDILISQGGADTLAGGRGNDAYYVGENADEVTIIENAGEGVDTVFSQAREFDLSKTADGQSIEYVILQAQPGLVSQSAKGDGQANVLVGNELANMLTGGAGNDQLYGYGGNDYLDGGNGNLDATVRAGVDYANGEADTLVGGLGDDQYIVRNAGDVVVEYAGQGTDQVYSFIDHALAANVENLTLLENGSGRNAWGNNLNNVITGNDKGNYINGGAGADTMIGGFGADYFVVDNVGDVVYGEPARQAPDGVPGGLNTMEAWVSVDLQNARQANGEQRYQGIDEVRLMGNGRLNATAYTNSSGMTLLGNAGANIITGSNGTWENGVHTGGNDSIAGGAGHDTIYAGEGNDTIVADGGNDQIWTGTGRDVIKITSGAIGANIQVKDFDATQDCVNESDPSIAGWTRTVAQSRANTVVTWTNPSNTRQKITLTLLNTQAWQVRFGQSEQTATSFNALEKDANTPWDITAMGSNTTITGGNNGDIITNTGSNNSLDGGRGNDTISAKGGDTVLGGADNDVITITDLGGATATSVDGGADQDWIQINGVKSGSATIAGGDGSDTVAFGGAPVALTLGATATLTKITSAGQTVNVTSSGIERFIGTAGNDSVDASAVAADYDAPIFVTNGGNDSYTGGAAKDYVHLAPLSATSALALDGGGDDADGMDVLMFDKSQAVNIDLTLDDDGRVAVDRNTFAVNGQKVTGTSIKGFETYALGDSNDTVTATSDAANAITNHAGFYVDAGGGNDVISVGDVNAHYALDLDGGAGNDFVSVGKITGAGNVTLAGGAGYDTLRVATGEGLTWKLDGAGNVASLNPMDDGTPLAGAAITGFEALDGSGNSANFFDAGDYTLTSGRSVVLSGGAGHDHFNLGTVQTGGAAYLYGGEGDDRFTLGLVGKNAVVQVNGGAGADRLSFANTDQAVRMTLNTAGDLAGAVTVAGQKTMVTSSGINQFQGGNGSDYIDARSVRTAQNGRITLSGGGATDWGNDTLLGGNTGVDLYAGNGRDSLAGGAGADRLVFGDADRATNDGWDTVVSGAGADTIVVNAHANGAHLFITDFQLGVDTLEDNHLFRDGWVRSAPVAMAGYAGRAIEYSKTENGQTTTFYLHFNNMTTVALANTLTAYFPGCAQIPANHKLDLGGTAGAVLVTGTAASEEVVASQGGSTIVGGGGDDSLQGNVGNDYLEVAGGSHNHVLVSGGGGNDVIRVAGDITGGEWELFGDVPNGYQDPIYGTEGSDTISTGGISGGTVSIVTGKSAHFDMVTVGDVSGSAALTVESYGGPDSVAVGNVSGGTVNVDTGKSNPAFTGVTSNDTISVGNVSGGTVELAAGGGNDVISIGNVSGGTVTANAKRGDNVFYLGALSGSGHVSLTSGDGNDTFYVADATTESLTHLDIMAGNGNDSVIFTGAAANVVLEAPGAVQGVFGFQGTAGNDYIDASAYTYGSGANHRIMVHGGEGNDTLIGGSNQLLTGGKGDDLLMVQDLSGNAWARGGDGTDTLSLEGVGANSFTLQGGAQGSGVPGAAATTTGVFTDNGTISLEEVEVIRLDGSQANTVQLNAKMTATLEFGDKADSLHITDGAAGSVIHIRNWKPDTHSLIAGSGWSSTARVVGGSTQYTFTKAGSTSVTVWLDGLQDLSGSTTGQTFNVTGGQTVLGTKGADVFNVSLGGNALYVKTNGAPGGKQFRDKVYLTVSGNSTAQNTLIATALSGVSSTHGRLYFQGTGIRATFGDVTGEDGMEHVGLTSLTANGMTATVTAYGFTRWTGTTGADFIDASAVTAIEYDPEMPWENQPNNTLEYDSEGGSDTYLGGAGEDIVSVYSVNGSINASTRMSMDGGAGIYDRLWFENARDARGNDVKVSVDLTLKGNGDVERVVYNGVDLTANGSSFTNFEHYALGDGNNRVDVGAYLRETVISVPIDENTKMLTLGMGSGADTIIGTGNMHSEAYSFLSTGEGNDLFDFTQGTLRTSEDIWVAPLVQLSGEEGNDTFRFNTAGHTASITAFSGDGSDRYEFYGMGPNFKLDDLKFSLQSNEYGEGHSWATLKVWNIDSQNDESNALWFQLGEGQYSGDGWDNGSWNTALAGDRMGFYNSDGAGYIAGDVDMQSIVDTIMDAGKDSGEEVSLTFSQQNGLWKATGVKS